MIDLMQPNDSGVMFWSGISRVKIYVTISMGK